jgi:hypothetical protein
MILTIDLPGMVLLALGLGFIAGAGWMHCLARPPA